MKVTIMRGHSGSGKTTKAIEIKNNSDVKTVIVSADDYFTKKGKYKFNHNLLRLAHDLCYNRFVKALEQGYNVVVDNTNILSWEFDKYINYCEENNHNYEIVVCNGNYTSIHNVPVEVIEKQKLNLAMDFIFQNDVEI